MIDEAGKATATATHCRLLELSLRAAFPPRGTWQDVKYGHSVVHPQVVVRRVQLGRHPASAPAARRARGATRHELRIHKVAPLLLVPTGTSQLMQSPHSLLAAAPSPT